MTPTSGRVLGHQQVLLSRRSLPHTAPPITPWAFFCIVPKKLTGSLPSRRAFLLTQGFRAFTSAILLGRWLAATTAAYTDSFLSTSLLISGVCRPPLALGLLTNPLRHCCRASFSLRHFHYLTPALARHLECHAQVAELAWCQTRKHLEETTRLHLAFASALTWYARLATRFPARVGFGLLFLHTGLLLTIN